MSPNPLLSIIIVNWNTAKITVDCLKSIVSDKGLSQINYEIILVDNASTDKSIFEVNRFKETVKSTNLSLKIIRNRTNVGFGKANNQALDIAKGNYILLLNTDTIILHSAISQSLNWLCSHPEAYGCTAQLLNTDKTIQPSGGYFPNLFNMATLLLHLDDLPLVNSLIPPYHPHPPTFYTRDRYYLRDHPQDWVTGAFMLLRQEVIKKVSGFHPDFFMYGEEMEMCYRIHQQFPHLQLWYLVGPQIIHLGGASSPGKQIIFDREYQGITTFFRIHKGRLSLKLVEWLISINQFLQLHLYRHLHRV